YLLGFAGGELHHRCDPAGRRRDGDGPLEGLPPRPEKGTGRMDREEAFEKFKGCAVEVLQVPAEKVTMDARFGDDLDADSLDLVELVMALEEQFDITVDESELEGIETVDQAFQLINSKL